jgi:HJR/Mrr/RecB family endonuclease
MYDDDDDHELHWESAAREAIEEAMTGAEFDPVRGVVILWSGHDHHYDSSRIEYSSYEDLYNDLIEIGETEWNNNVPWMKGPVFSASVDGYVENVIADHSIEDFFFGKYEPQNAELLLATNDLISPAGSAILTADVQQISAELIRYLALHPEKLNELNPRKFEELVAELFIDMGYEVDLTPATRDGGFDLRAVSKNEVGTALTLVECKRYTRDRKVGVELVRNLYGVVESESATKGLLVTTSFFTAEAQKFQQKREYRLGLADYRDVTDFLNNYRGRR